MRRAAPGLLATAAVALLASGVVGASCGQSALGILPGVVNDPHNLSLRRAILEFGSARMCGELQNRGVPLKLRDEDPITGRFYATTCMAQLLANESLFLQFGGNGYAWTNVTKRMGFDAGAAVEYDHDFLMNGGTMYVYFRHKSTSASSFNTVLIEQPGVAVVGGLPMGQTGQSFANAFGAAILKEEIARGFTVIRDADGHVEFGLGVVELGKRPPSPYKPSASGRALLANERAEVHQEQRDFAGPFEVDGKGKALWLTALVEGAQGVDVLVVPRGTGQAWIQSHTHQAPLGPPPGMAMLDEPVFAGAMWRRTIALPEGQYFVVFDNSSTAGRSAPTGVAGDDRAALVTYAVELGDAP